MYLLYVGECDEWRLWWDCALVGLYDKCHNMFWLKQLLVVNGFSIRKSSLDTFKQRQNISKPIFMRKPKAKIMLHTQPDQRRSNSLRDNIITCSIQCFRLYKKLTSTCNFTGFSLPYYVKGFLATWIICFWTAVKCLMAATLNPFKTHGIMYLKRSSVTM